MVDTTICMVCPYSEIADLYGGGQTMVCHKMHSSVDGFPWTDYLECSLQNKAGASYKIDSPGRESQPLYAQTHEQMKQIVKDLGFDWSKGEPVGGIESYKTGRRKWLIERPNGWVLAITAL